MAATLETVPQSIRGTPAYMAPELDGGAVPTRASDVYAVGVMLFQALSGRLPIDGPHEDAHSFDADVPKDLVAMCSAMLDHDPARRPAIEDVLGVLRVPAQRARARSNEAAFVPFVGREAELSQLQAAFLALRAGKPVATFIHGRSGIGKSVLANRFAQDLSGQATVLRARCYERESLPYKAFDGLVDALRQHMNSLPHDQQPKLAPLEAAALVRVFPTLELYLPADLLAAQSGSLADVQELRQRAFQALKSLLYQLAGQGALVLMVDDLQWADRDSARLLMELLGPPYAPALLYVGCYRDEEARNSEFLTELAADEQWQCDRRPVPLGPLGPELSATLARELLKMPVEQSNVVALRIAREAQGVPLFISELAAYFVSELASGDTELSLSDLLSHRVLGLAVAERRVLSLLSLAARPVAPWLLSPAFDDAPSLQRALRVLGVQGLVQSDAHGRLVVYHDQLRELLSGRLNAGDASQLHRVLAEAYERVHGVEPEWLIEHWRGAGEPTRALQYAISAAELAARKLAFNRAVALYQTALELEQDAAGRCRLHAMLGEALVNAGRGAAAARAFLNAVDPSDAEGARSLRSRAVQQFLRTGHKAEAQALLEPLFSEVGSRYPRNAPQVALRLVASRLRLACWSRLGPRSTPPADARVRQRLVVLGAVFRECSIVDPLRGLLFQSEFYENAIRANERTAMFIGFAWDTYNRAALGGWKKRHMIAKRLERLEAMAGELETHYAQAVVLLMRGATGLQLGDWCAATELSGRARSMFREHCPGANWEEAISSYVNSAGRENVGPISAMLHDVPLVVRHANERVDQLTDALLSVTMGSALLAEDKATEARAFVEERLARLSGDMDMQLFGVILRTIDTALYARDGERAWSNYERLWPDYLRSGYDRSEWFSAFYRLRRARAALSLSSQRGDTRLHHVVEAEAKRLDRVGRPDFISLAEQLKAALAFQRGNLEEARRRLSVCSAASERVGLRVSAICARLQLGRITPGVEGEQLYAAGAAELRAQGVVNPDRWAELYSTGFSAG
jgi:hypothetical protein